MFTEQEASEFMDTLFEYEFCAECKGDKQHHTVCVGPFGLPFARCNHPFGADDKPHPVIVAFHKSIDNADILAQVS